MNQSIIEEHARRLGQLVGNLLTIEMGARMVVAKLDRWQERQITTQFSKVKQGDWVELSPLTNGDDLSQTLEKYNKYAPVDCRVEVRQIVRLRDALAHGRAFGFGPYTPATPLRLLKFGTKKQENKVEVMMAVDMTNEWFRENNKFLFDALKKITKALNYEMHDLQIHG